MSEFWRGFFFGACAVGGLAIPIAILIVDRFMRPFR